MSTEKNIDKYEFKQKKPFEVRKEESNFILTKFPNKIPVIVERFYKEQELPLLDKSKFLVPHDITVSEFLVLIRSRLKLRSSQAIYLMANNRTLVSLGTTFGTVYSTEVDPDGFLYLTYASQDMFG